jgi:hypothetical protein
MMHKRKKRFIGKRELVGLILGTGRVVSKPTKR